jgi:nitroreductase
MGSAPQFAREEIDRLLTTTRSVRRRLDLERAVDPRVVLDCIRLAVQAPTAGNEELWRWVVVTDPLRRAELARIYRAAGLDWLRSALAEAADEQAERVYSSALYLADVLDRVPVHVIPCIVGRPDPGQPGMAADVFGSILPAAWSLMLALRSRGLGAAWTTIHLGREREAAELLGIPDDVLQVALLPVAYTLGTEFKPARRRPAEDVTFWNAWGENAAPSAP